VTPVRVVSRRDVLARPAPARAGVYGWWLRRWPSLVAASGCCHHDGLALLYVGISPKQPPRNGRPASRQSLAARIRYHYTGNAEGSTLAQDAGLPAGRRAGYPAAPGRIGQPHDVRGRGTGAVHMDGRVVHSLRAGTPRIVRSGPSGVKGAAKAMSESAYPWRQRPLRLRRA
jgi:hypothetical protein